MSDKREVHFEDKRKHVFKGAGQALGGETKPSRLVPSNLEEKYSDTQEPAEYSVETTSQLPGIFTRRCVTLFDLRCWKSCIQCFQLSLTQTSL